jgi:adenine/guanine phosphoribosyltransferase-like PRPP-binding protein
VPAMLSRRVLRWSQGAAASAGAALGLTVSDGPKPVAHAAAGGSLARISYGQREAAISCAETEPGLAHFLPDQASPQVQQIAAKCRYYSPAFSPKDVPAFYDLSGITEDAAVFQRTVDLFVHRYQEQIERGCGPTVVVGYDARGFVLGPPVALALKVTSLQPTAAASTAQHSTASQPASQCLQCCGVRCADGCPPPSLARIRWRQIPFVLLRKAGKNPGPLVESSAYSKEYAEHQPDRMCVRLGAVVASDRVLLIDDLIATGRASTLLA